MIKIKLKRKLWFYPHRCPDFGSVVIKLDDHWSIEPLELA